MATFTASDWMMWEVDFSLDTTMGLQGGARGGQQRNGAELGFAVTGSDRRAPSPGPRGVRLRARRISRARAPPISMKTRAGSRWSAACCNARSYATRNRVDAPHGGAGARVARARDELPRGRVHGRAGRRGGGRGP